MADKIASVYAEIGADTRKLKQGLTETKGGLQNVAKGFQGFKLETVAAFGAITGAVVAAKKAWDFGKEGVQLELVRGKFDNLAASIGLTSNSLLIDLKRATKGLVSDSQLIGSATDFMSLGLAKTHDQVVRLTRVAGALSMDMNQLVLTLANKTTMRFDQLGVAVDGFDERLKKLKDSGMDVNAAFTEAFLQQAEAQIEKVGDVSETNAGKIKQMEASLANLSDTAKLKAAPAVALLANEITLILGPSKDLIDYNTVQIKTVKGVQQAYYEFNGVLINVTEAYREWLSLQVLSNSKTPELMDAQKGYTRATEETGNATQEAGNKAERSWGQFYGLSEAIKRGGKEAEEAKPEIKSLLDGIDRNIDSPIAAFIKDLEFYRQGGGMFIDKFEEIKKALDEGKITPAEAQEYSKELFIAVADFQEEIGQIDATEAAQNISETMGASVQEAKEWIDGTDSVTSALTAVSSKQWFIDIYYREHNKPSGAPGGAVELDPGLVPGGAHGLSGIVPPGFPGDSYLVGATSGEHVQITPQGQGGGGGDVYVVQNFYDQGAAALGMAYVETLRGQRLDASMGR